MTISLSLSSPRLQQLFGRRQLCDCLLSQLIMSSFNLLHRGVRGCLLIPPLETLHLGIGSVVNLLLRGGLGIASSTFFADTSQCQPASPAWPGGVVAVGPRTPLDPLGSMGRILNLFNINFLPHHELWTSDSGGGEGGFNWECGLSPTSSLERKL